MGGERTEKRITLRSAYGADLEFTSVATIACGESVYAILLPAQPIEGMAEDEAIVFEVTNEGDQEKYDIVLDDEVIDAVFEEYANLIEAAKKPKPKKTRKKKEA